MITKQYVPKRGVYISEGTIYSATHDLDTQDLQKIVKSEKLKECDVCELGACFLSLIRFENNANVYDLNNFRFSRKEGMHDDYGSSRARLAEVFGDKQLTLIESCFEGKQMISNYQDRPAFEEINSAEIFSQFKLMDFRIISISLNIIQNNGIFTPAIPVKLAVKYVNDAYGKQ